VELLYVDEDIIDEPVVPAVTFTFRESQLLLALL